MKIPNLIKKIIDNSNSKVILYIFLSINLLFVVLSLTYINRAYNDYIYGKFDLGNMNQMLYNTARGNFMELTGQFGGYISRFAMSHVDPSLLIFVPVSWFYSDAFFLLIVLVLSFGISSFLLYLISKNEGLDNIHASIIGILIFLFPISGFIIVWTAFHPLVLAMPFLLFAYYLMQRLNNEHFKLKKIKYLSITNYQLLLTLTYFSFTMVILSKEELGFVVFALTPFLLNRFNKLQKHIKIISVISLMWSLIAFFIIIPAFEQQRIESFEGFLNYINEDDVKNYEGLISSNFFLHRYEEFGDTYLEVLLGLIKNPLKVITSLFSFDMLNTYRNLLVPTAFSILFIPLLLVAALPEILIHGLSGDSNIFSIENHRLMILIPLFSLSIIYVTKKIIKKHFNLSYIYLLAIVVLSFITSIQVKNPLIYPIYEKFLVVSKISAEDKKDNPEWNALLDTKCADYLLSEIKNSNYVSVPQPFGGKTSNKKYNALFPTGLDTADTIIVDILERKVTDFLGLNFDVNKKIINKFIKENNINIIGACNRFILIKTANKNNYTLEVVDKVDDLNKIEFINKGEKFFTLANSNIIVQDNNLLNSYTFRFDHHKNREVMFAYTILTNGKDTWSYIHFPSYYYNAVNDVDKDLWIRENFTIEIPSYIPKNNIYSVYFGIGHGGLTNKNIKIGELEL